MNRLLAPSLGVLTLLLAGCATLLVGCTGGGAKQSTAPTVPAVDREAEILRLEASRRDPGGRLIEYLGDGEEEIRAQAAAALGRLPLERHGSAVTRALEAALQDNSARVRSRAAFALGQRGDVSAAPAMTRRLRDRSEADPEVRAALVDGGSRLPDAELREEILFALSDPSSQVRQAAAVAPHRWTEEPPIGPDAAQIESVLVQITGKRPLVEGRPAEVPGYDYFEAEEEDAEVIWRALFTLQRRSALRARQAFHVHSRARFPLESRLFAIKGLSNLALLDRGRDEGSRKVLEGALTDSDWRVVCEALKGIENYASTDSLVALVPLLRHRSPHVRRSLWQTLGALPLRRPTELAEPVEKALTDRSEAVRASAIVAGTRLLFFGEERLATLLEDPSIWARAAVAEAAVDLPEGSAAGRLLVEAVADEHPTVAGRAASSLGEILFREDVRDLQTAAQNSLREILVELTQSEDLGLRLASVQALAGHCIDADLPFLERAFEGSQGDLGPEVRFHVLRNLSELEGAEATELLVSAQSDAHPYVSDVARGLVRERVPERLADPVPYRGTLSLADLDPELLEETRDHPVVEVHTTRGLMVFELFPEVAPLHVANFLAMAKRGFYEDLTFHRVVADFVVQGGCYRGDGNGSLTLQEGRSLPAEISPRPYVRGSLGMPRNEYLDSGGSQIFITHRATPHLDGRYTLFGELRTGFDVLESIELGDRILSIRRRTQP